MIGRDISFNGDDILFVHVAAGGCETVSRCLRAKSRWKRRKPTAFHSNIFVKAGTENSGRNRKNRSDLLQRMFQSPEAATINEFYYKKGSNINMKTYENMLLLAMILHSSLVSSGTGSSPLPLQPVLTLDSGLVGL